MTRNKIKYLMSTNLAANIAVPTKIMSTALKYRIVLKNFNFPSFFPTFLFLTVQTFS